MDKIKRRLKKQAEREEKYQPPRSRLNPPVEEWTGDLPERAEDCGFPPKLIWVNELNDCRGYSPLTQRVQAATR